MAKTEELRSADPHWMRRSPSKFTLHDDGSLSVIIPTWIFEDEDGYEHEAEQTYSAEEVAKLRRLLGLADGDDRG